MAEDDDRKIDSARKNWEERKLNPALKRGPERKPKFVTSSGIEVKRAYDPDDLNGQDFVNDLGFPGEYPFTRGVQPTMYRDGCGRCASTRASAAPRNRTAGTVTFSIRGRPVSRSRSICPRRWAATRIIRWPTARSDVSVCRFARLPTWRRCSPSCRSTKFRPR